MWQAELKLTGAEGLRQGQINAAVRDSMHALGLRHRRRNLPSRFTKAGARKLGFKPRRGESNPQRRGTYSNRKLRLLGHVLPNVYSGELRRLTLYGVRDVRATATSREAKVRIVLPRKANLHHPRGPNTLEELRSVAADERADLERFLVEDLERRLSRAGARGATVAAGLRAG